MESIIGGFISLAIFGVMTGFIAKSRGHNPIAWGLVGFAVPIIGIVAVALFPVNEKILVERRISEGELKRCPQCAEAIQPAAKLCPYCQTKLEDAKTGVA